MSTVRTTTLTALAAAVLALTLTGCGGSSTEPDGGEQPQPEAETAAWATLEEAALSWQTLTYQGQYAEACRYLSERAQAVTLAVGGCEAFLPRYVDNHHLRSYPFDDATVIEWISWAETEEQLRERYAEFNDGNGYFLIGIGSAPGTPEPIRLEDGTKLRYSNRYQHSSAAFFGWDEARGGWVVTDFQYTW